MLRSKVDFLIFAIFSIHVDIFLVIGERIIVPSSIVQLLVKVRINTALGISTKEETPDDVESRLCVLLQK